MDMEDRARGAILGMAIGEALGAPLEGLTREEIEKRAGRITGFINPAKTQPEHRSLFFQYAVYEAETQTALAAVDVLSRKKRFMVDLFQERLGELGQHVEGNVFGCYRRARRNLRVAVRRILSGAEWRESGVNTAGSGAASRGIPLGVFFHDKPEERVRSSVEATLVTHRDPRACAATAAVAEMTALAVQAEDGKLDAEEAIQALKEAARKAEDLCVAEHASSLFPDYEEHKHQFSEALGLLEELVDLDVDDALARVIENAADKAARPITSATKGFALTGVISALYFFLTGLDMPFAETVLDTIAEGGSTDTLGCLVGGLCGALHGASGIPEEWVRKLRNSKQVQERALAMVNGNLQSLAPLVLEEARLCRPAPRPQKKKSRGPQRRMAGRRGMRPHGGMRGRGGPMRRGRPGGRGPTRGGRPRSRPGGGPRYGRRSASPQRAGYGGPRRNDGGYRGGGGRQDGPRRPDGGYRGGPPRSGGGYRRGGGGPRGGHAPRHGGYRGDGRRWEPREGSGRGRGGYRPDDRRGPQRGPLSPGEREGREAREDPRRPRRDDESRD